MRSSCRCCWRFSRWSSQLRFDRKLCSKVPALAVVPEETAEKSGISPAALPVIASVLCVPGPVVASNALSIVSGRVAVLNVFSAVIELVVSSNVGSAVINKL